MHLLVEVVMIQSNMIVALHYACSGERVIFNSDEPRFYSNSA